jgi:nitrous oxidase accessory protein NosD
LIEGNIIAGPETGPGASRCIFISRADDVTIRYNELSNCRTPIGTEFSEHVVIHDNAVVPNSEDRAGMSQATR